MILILKSFQNRRNYLKCVPNWEKTIQVVYVNKWTTEIVPYLLMNLDLDKDKCYNGDIKRTHWWFGLSSC